MTRRSFATLFCLILLCCACGRSGRPDAYGIIDAHSWMVAASEAGQIVDLQAEEGLRVARGTQGHVAYAFDTVIQAGNGTALLIGQEQQRDPAAGLIDRLPTEILFCYYCTTAPVLAEVVSLA